MLLMLAMSCANVPELVGFNSKYIAAIDKMYLKDYYVFDEFRLWCLIHNPIDEIECNIIQYNSFELAQSLCKLRMGFNILFFKIPFKTKWVVINNLKLFV